LLDFATPTRGPRKRAGMARRLILRPQAEADLESIRAFVAADSPPAAVRFVASIENRCRSLLDFPGQGRARGDLFKGLRVLPFGRSVVIGYVSTEEAVEVLRVWYGGQNYEDFFKR
jgi:toxin ParE1/3/4